MGTFRVLEKSNRIRANLKLLNYNQKNDICYISIKLDNTHNVIVTIVHKYLPITRLNIAAISCEHKDRLYANQFLFYVQEDAINRYQTDTIH